MYTFMKKQFENEMDAVVEWSKQNDTYRRGYMIFHNRSSLRTYSIESKEKLKGIVKGMNNIEVKFPNSNKIYMYRSFDRIDFNKIESVTFVETRGIQRHICSWLRVYCINGELIGVC